MDKFLTNAKFKFAPSHCTAIIYIEISSNNPSFSHGDDDDGWKREKSDIVSVKKMEEQRILERKSEVIQNWWLKRIEYVCCCAVYSVNDDVNDNKLPFMNFWAQIQWLLCSMYWIIAESWNWQRFDGVVLGDKLDIGFVLLTFSGNLWIAMIDKQNLLKHPKSCDVNKKAASYIK